MAPSMTQPTTDSSEGVSVILHYWGNITPLYNLSYYSSFHFLFHYPKYIPPPSVCKCSKSRVRLCRALFACKLNSGPQMRRGQDFENRRCLSGMQQHPQLKQRRGRLEPATQHGLPFRLRAQTSMCVAPRKYHAAGRTTKSTPARSVHLIQ